MGLWVAFFFVLLVVSSPTTTAFLQQCDTTTTTTRTIIVNRQHQEGTSRSSSSNGVLLFRSVVDIDDTRNSLLLEDKEETVLSSTTATPHLIFPGGGLFFYWQAGAITYLREQGYNLTNTCTAAGASAGALTATLSLTDVDFYQATELALDMSAKAGVWDRSEGLQGIWGPLIYDWLDQLLPQDAVDQVTATDNQQKLSLLVTPIPSFGKDVISDFTSRQDLIECNMASVHLPWFLDGKLTATFRNRPHIDGSFLSKDENYQLPTPSTTEIRFDWTEDPAYQERGFFDFVNAGVSPDLVWGILEQGKTYARQMEEQGRFAAIPKLNNKKDGEKQPSGLLEGIRRKLTIPF